jgi:hypothetical protein
MNSSTKHRFVAFVVSALLASAPIVAPVPAQAATGLLCRAHMQDATPAQYTYNRAYVTTRAYARIRTVAHYKTTNTTKYGKANSAGRGSTRYYISGSTPGYRVYVDVYVSKSGRTGHCRTSFVSHR